MPDEQPPTSPGATPPSERPVFELEPLPEPERKPEPPRGAPLPAAAGKIATPAASREPQPGAEPARGGLLGRLGGMLEGFDDDADFEHDPEVEAALNPRPAGVGGMVPAGAPDRPALVKAWGPGPAAWAAVGGTLLIGAVIATAVNEKDHPIVGSVLTVYNAGVHTCTGVLALAVSAMLLRRRLGAIEQAAARMFVAVAALLIPANLRISLIGHGAWEEITLATVVYVLAVAGLFRVWGRPLAYVVCSHFLIWIVVQIGMQLSVSAASKP